MKRKQVWNGWAWVPAPKQRKPKMLIWNGWTWVAYKKPRRQKMPWGQALQYAHLPQDQFQAYTGITWKQRLERDLF